MSTLHNLTYKFNAFFKFCNKMLNFWNLKGNFRVERESMIAKNIVKEKIEHGGTLYLLNSITYRIESVKESRVEQEKQWRDYYNKPCWQAPL